MSVVHIRSFSGSGCRTRVSNIKPSIKVASASQLAVESGIGVVSGFWDVKSRPSSSPKIERAVDATDFDSGAVAGVDGSQSKVASLSERAVRELLSLMSFWSSLSVVPVSVIFV